MSNDALALSHACRWLEDVADAAKQREVTMEMELPGGRYLVAEEWPSKAAYRDHAVNLETLGKMVAVSRISAAWGE
jgi:hypothetical protein